LPLSLLLTQLTPGVLWDASLMADRPIRGTDAHMRQQFFLADYM
jgi:hypothetical protein